MAAVTEAHPCFDERAIFSPTETEADESPRSLIMPQNSRFHRSIVPDKSRHVRWVVGSTFL